MIWIEDEQKNSRLNGVNGEESDGESSNSSGEELPIWVRGVQRWVSGVIEETTCRDVIKVLLQDEENRGRHVGPSEDYHITERWRGVEQPLDGNANILDIWNAWGTAQTEVKISLRRIKQERSLRRARFRSDSSMLSADKNSFKTIHPKRLSALQNEKQPSSTEELLKLVLAQGEVIRKQLKKLRCSEHQIGFLEDKTHRARVRKHGSNYLLETYLKGLSEALEPAETPTGDKNSDSGVVTEGDEQSNHNTNKATGSNESSFEGFSTPSSQEFSKDLKDDDTSSTISEATVREQLDLLEKIAKMNRKLLKEEEQMVRLEANLKRQQAKSVASNSEVTKNLSALSAELAKSSCELQHNELVLSDALQAVQSRRGYLEVLHRDLSNEDREFEMLQTLLYTQTTLNRQHQNRQLIDYNNYADGNGNSNSNSNTMKRNNYQTKELLDTLV